MGLDKVEKAVDVLDSVLQYVLRCALEAGEVKHNSENAVEIVRVPGKNLPRAHPINAYIFTVLAHCRARSGQLEEAIYFHEDALSLRLSALYDLKFARVHIEVLESLVHVANIRVDKAINCERDMSIDKRMLGEVVNAFREEILPLIAESLDDKQVLYVYAKGSSAVALKALGGGTRSESMINDALRVLMKDFQLPRAHPWVVRLNTHSSS